VSPNKVACPNCKGKFKIDKLRIHLKYFCGEGAQRTEAQARQRRSTDAPGNQRQGKGSHGKGKPKKPPMTTKADKQSATKGKNHAIRVKSTGDYESDSEISVEGPVLDIVAGSRPSRSAAAIASKRISSSARDWPTERHSKDDDDDDDDSSFASDGGDDSLSSDGSFVSRAIVRKRQAETYGKMGPAKKRPAESSDASLKRAREKQRKAFADAKKEKTSQKLGKKKVFDEGSNDSSDAYDFEAESHERARMKQKKSTVDAKKQKPPKTRKSRKSTKSVKGKKKKFDDDSDDSSDDSPEVADDPLEGIDMNELVHEAMSGSQFSALHSLCWWRIVLDEAHYIKSRSSQTAAAAFALSGIHRWCLSGTPLQNRVGELYSLIRFLRIDPMSHYFCRQKGCRCKSIHYRMKNGKCQDCDHRPFMHFSHFNKHVLNPIQRDGYTGDGRRAMFKLKNEILDKCLLRRTKETRAEDMNLPPRIVTIRTIRLHPVEEDFYNALYMQTRSSFDDYIAEGTLLNNYAHIFVGHTD
jgi:DNA repair protein RAD16